MSSQFPTSIVTTTNIPTASPSATLAASNHTAIHNNLRDEVIAVETAVGITGSADNTSLSYKNANITGGDRAIGASQTVTTTNKTLGTGTKVALGSDATGDTYYNGGSGTLTRVGIGSNGQVLTSNGTNPTWSSPSATNLNYIADTGAVNALVATLSPALGSYTAGTLVQVKVAVTNTGATTINVNGLGAKTIKKLDGATDLAAGDLVAGQVVSLEYDSTNFQLQSPQGTPFKSNYQAFTASGTWTKPAGLSGNEMVTVQVWGGGGGGGGAAAGAAQEAGGGGGGTYSEAKFKASDLGSTVTVTIGAAGTAGAAGASGGAGGNTTFGSLLTAYGGGGGGPASSSNYGGGGGGAGINSAGTTATTTTGGNGGGVVAGAGGAPSALGGSSSFGGGGGGGTGASGGSSAYGGGGGAGGNGLTTGGASVYGGGGGGGRGGGGSSIIYGGNGGTGTSDSNGTAGTAPGGGGGGGCNTSSLGARTGGAGARGECRVFINILSN